MKTYKYTSDMVKEAIANGYKHTGGRGFVCKGCKSKNSMRKFTKNGHITHACKCGYRRT